MFCLIVCLHVSLKKVSWFVNIVLAGKKTNFFLANVDVLAEMGMVVWSLERFHVHFEFIFFVLLASPSKALDVPSMTGLLACKGCLGSDALGQFLDMQNPKDVDTTEAIRKQNCSVVANLFGISRLLRSLE